MDEFELEDFKQDFGGLEALAGKTIRELSMSPEKNILKLSFFGRDSLYIVAEGGCCSKSWFEHIQGIDALYSTIQRIVPRPMKALVDDESDEDFRKMKIYGWTLETNKGRCDFEMRNESNGYYGGKIIVGVSPIDKYGYPIMEYSLESLTQDF